MDIISMIYFEYYISFLSYAIRLHENGKNISICSQYPMYEKI